MNKLPSNYSAAYVPFSENFTIEVKGGDKHSAYLPSTWEAYSDILDSAKRQAVQVQDQTTTGWLQRFLAEPAYVDVPVANGEKSYLDQCLQSFFRWFDQSRRPSRLLDDEDDVRDVDIAPALMANKLAARFSIWDDLLAYVLGEAANQHPDDSSPGIPNAVNIASVPSAALVSEVPVGQSVFAPGKAGATGNVSLSATQPPNSISVKDFGAKGDGVSDDQAAIQNAFEAAKASGRPVWLPPGTYHHSGVLTANGIHVSGAGESTVLRATHPDQGALKLTGNHGAISNITIELNSGHRSSMPDAAAICVQAATNATVSHVKTVGAASNGIRLDNALNCKITNNFVMGSNADGIALMNGSCFNTVENNVVYQAGDDAFSDNSYIGDHRQDEGNVFRNNLALDNKYGRGFALMGSKNATVENCYSHGTPGHGIAAGTDYNSDTMVGTGHVIRNNVFLDARATPIAADGMTLLNNQVTGTAPSLFDILGWTPSKLLDRSMYNAAYVPGTGPGANNTPGNRT